MASQVQLTNTFNEFRQAYNDAANDISTLQSSNTTVFSSIAGANSSIAGANVLIANNTSAIADITTDGTGALYANTLQLSTLENSGSRVLVTAPPGSGNGARVVDDAGFIFHTANDSVEIVGSLSLGADATVTGNVSTTGTTTSTGTLTVGSTAVVVHAANGSITSATGNIELNTTTSSVNAYHIHATQHLAAGGDVEDWASGKGTDPNQHRVAGIGDLNGPVDMVIVNESDGVDAYAEFIAVNDTGDIDNGWISMGINSSNYGEAEYAVTKNDDGYILYQPPAGTSANGDLVIGTGSNGTRNRVLISANGFDDPANNTQITIDPDNFVRIQINTESANTTTGALVVQGGMGLTGNLNVGGNVAITGTITLGGGGNTVTTDSLAVENPIIFVGQNNAADTFDLGFVGIYNDGVEKYTGIVRDANDNGMYKLFANSSILPANTVDFTDAGIQYGSVMVGTAQIVDGTDSSSNTTGALIVTGGVGIAKSLTVGQNLVVEGSATFTGAVRVQELVEDVVDVAQSSNELALDYTAGNVFYKTGTFTDDFLPVATNVPTTDGRITTLSVIVPQDGTARRPKANTISINGTNTLINWVGGNTSFTPTASKTDIFNFTILRRSATFTVAGTVTANTVL